MVFTFGDVRKALKKKGFSEEKDRDHVYLRLYYQGKKTSLYTKCSHGKDGDDVGDKIVSAMKLQLGLENRRQVADLVNCPMTETSYLEIQKESGRIPSK